MQRKRLSLPSLPLRAPVSAATSTPPPQTTPQKAKKQFGKDITNSATRNSSATTPSKPIIVEEENTRRNHHHQDVTCTPATESEFSLASNNNNNNTIDDESSFVLAEKPTVPQQQTKTVNKLEIETATATATTTSASSSSTENGTTASTTSSSTPSTSTSKTTVTPQKQQEDATMKKSKNDKESSSASSPSLDTDNFELTEDFMSPAPPPSSVAVASPSSDTRKAVPQKKQETIEEQVGEQQMTKTNANEIQDITSSSVPLSTATTTTNTTNVDQQQQQQDDILILRSQIRRLQLENSRLSEEASFFRQAATNMKQQAIFGKQQLLSELEHFTEPLMREEIEESFETSWGEIVEVRFSDQKHFLESVKMMEKERDEWMKEAKKNFNQHHSRNLNQNQNENKNESEDRQQVSSLKQELLDTQSELTSLKKATREMCKSWQSRFDSLKSEKSSLESLVSETQKELMSLKNVAAFVENQQKSRSSRVKDVGVDVSTDRVAMFEIHQLQNEDEVDGRSELVSCQEVEFSSLSFIGESLLRVMQQFSENKKESERKLSIFSAETAKYKSRFDQVSNECEDLVVENKKLHDELLALRKENFTV